MKPATVRGLLIALLLIVQAATFAMVIVQMQAETAKNVSTHARQTLLSLSKTAANRVERYLAPAERTLKTGRQLIASAVLKPNGDEQIIEFFNGQLSGNSYIKGLFLGRSDGSFVYVNKTESGLRTKRVRGQGGNRFVELSELDSDANVIRRWIDPTDTYDPRKRPWYQKATDGRAVNPIVWTDAYTFFTSRQPGISSATRVFDEFGQEAGVLGVDVEVTDLSAFIADFPNAKKASAAIVAKDGTLIATSELAQLASALATKKDSGMPTFESFVGEPLRKVLSLSRRNSKDQSSGSTLVHELQIDGSVHLGLSRSLSLLDNKLKWQLLIQLPRDDYSGGLISFLTGNLRLLLALGILPALAIAAVVAVTNPVYRMHQDATTDSLTGTLSRQEFLRRLDELTGKARRQGDGVTKVAVVAVDLDQFKSINDQHGHHAGDTVLCEVARRLQANLGDGDIVSRVGGDEFLLALNVTLGADVWQAAERLRRGVVSDPLVVGNSEHRIGATVGVATCKIGEDDRSLVFRADQALIYGKSVRKNVTYLAEAVAPVQRSVQNSLVRDDSPTPTDSLRPSPAIA